MPARVLAAVAVVVLMSGCSTIGYYGHVLRGGFEVLWRREPIEQLLADPAQDPALKARLAQFSAARRFAVSRLALPEQGSYRSYSDLQRPYAVWNVFAAPELSLTPVEHCFPVAGCVAYRGYFEEAKARAEASRLRAQGFETFVGGVAAYSTLGWFSDPLLSTMLRWDDDRLHATLFHELAHERVYVPGDTAFNESYGKFVELEGLKAWRAARGLPERLPEEMAFEDRFIGELLLTRNELAALYAGPSSDTAKREGKAAAFATLRQRLTTLLQAEGAPQGYQQFVDAPMNNARLLPFGLYHQWRGAFAALFAAEGQSWERFHDAVAALAALPPEVRERRLQSLRDAHPESVAVDAPPSS
jgi:predicted aminopeptidase